MFSHSQIFNFSSSFLNALNVTDKLKDEHKQILRLLNSIPHVENTKLLENGPQIVDFIRNFADKYHHAKEENILFRYFVDPKAMRPEAQLHCNPIPVMLGEHEEGREFVEMVCPYSFFIEEF